MSDEDSDIVFQVVDRIRKKQGWVRVNCPLCVYVDGKADTRQSLGVNFATGGYICHKCQSTGLVPAFAPELDIAEQDLALPVSVAPDGSPATGEIVEPEVEIESWFGYVPLALDPTEPTLEWARQYVLGRGISWDAIIGAEIGAANIGALRNRIIVPHWAPTNELAGWVGRDVTGAAYLKYRYSKGMKRKLLWNQRALDEQTDQPLALCEGVFDALPLWPDVAAFLGKPTSWHIETLSAHRGRPLVVLLDGDARYEAWALANRLKLAGVPSVGVAILPPGEDPSSLGRAESLRLAHEAVGRIPRYV